MDLRQPHALAQLLLHEVPVLDAPGGPHSGFDAGLEAVRSARKRSSSMPSRPSPWANRPARRARCTAAPSSDRSPRPRDRCSTSAQPLADDLLIRSSHLETPSPPRGRLQREHLGHAGEADDGRFSGNPEMTPLRNARRTCPGGGNARKSQGPWSGQSVVPAWVNPFRQKSKAVSVLCLPGPARAPR